MTVAKKPKLNPGEPAALTASTTRRQLLDYCMAAGANFIYADFNGSGDDGQVEAATAYADEACSTRVALSSHLQEAVDNMVREIIEQFCMIDWCNNDGGGGRVRITTGETHSVVMASHQNEMQQVEQEPVVLDEAALDAEAGLA